RTGAPMRPQTWHDPGQRVLQMLRSGRPAADADALVVLNGSLEQQRVTLPHGRGRGRDLDLAWDSTWERPEDGRYEADAEPFELLASPAETVAMEPLSMRLYLARP
ncbi:glycogen debranching enzyme GlgX, partial [Georgenia sp. 10Sc9-8]|nr:glycogen debranching enzyme GlgX [Georgenia halotolerans]